MKLIYMAKTIEYIVNQSASKETVKWATELIQNNEVKETKTGTKYILINEI